MTSAAWIMLALTWSVIFFFCFRFFFKVLSIPPEREANGLETAAEVEDISQHD